MRQRRRTRRCRLRKRGRGIAYIFKNKVYLGKRPQKGSGAISKIVARALENIGNVIRI